MTHTSLFAPAFSTSGFNFFFGAMSSGNPYVSSNKNWMNQQAFHSIPMQPSAGVPCEGMASSESKPVEGEVLDINVGSKRFKLIPEPFMEDYPGAGGNPYPTADIRRSMMQPSCSVRSADPRHGVGEHMVLYGYFSNKTEEPTELVPSSRSWKERSTSFRTKLHFSSRFCFGMLGSIHLGERPQDILHGSEPPVLSSSNPQRKSGRFRGPSGRAPFSDEGGFFTFSEAPFEGTLHEGFKGFTFGRLHGGFTFGKGGLKGA